jgi:hypothetical protein
MPKRRDKGAHIIVVGEHVAGIVVEPQEIQKKLANLDGAVSSFVPDVSQCNRNSLNKLLEKIKLEGLQG